jgi:hypothetical protein
MALTIVVGYTGIPIYKMICNKDGHIVVSIAKNVAVCNHTATKDCCAPKHIKQTTPAESCCANSSDFLKLHESSEVNEQHNHLNQVATSIPILVAPILLTHYNIKAKTHLTFPPPFLFRKQSTQSFTQVFLI